MRFYRFRVPYNKFFLIHLDYSVFAVFDLSNRKVVSDGNRFTITVHFYIL